MKVFRIYVTYKPSVFDPQGETITDAAHDLGYSTVEKIHVGKFFDVEINPDETDCEAVIKSLADKLLVNFNLEIYRYEQLEDK